MMDRIIMKLCLLIVLMPSSVLLSSELLAVPKRPLSRSVSFRSMSASSSVNPESKADKGYTMSSSSFFSRITQTVGLGGPPSTQVSNLENNNSTNDEMKKLAQHDPQNYYYDDDLDDSSSPEGIERRQDKKAMKMQMKMAKKNMMMNALKSMAKMKMKYKLKSKKMKYKLKQNKMKYKYKTKKLKYKKGCGKKACKMSIPQLVNFQKISYKKVPVPVHYKLYKRMMRGEKIPLGEPYGEPFPESYGEPLSEPFAEPIAEAASEPESWYGSPLGGLPEPFPEIAFPLPEPEISINKKFVSYNYLDDYGAGQPGPTQNPLYIYEEYYDDAPTASSLLG